MNIEDLGYQIKKNPITQVRCSFHEGKWFVEYRLKKSRFFIDKWWWYDDSKYANYLDAHARAEFLASVGYYETMEKKVHIYDVKGE
jgi:hypothetical protein